MIKNVGIGVGNRITQETGQVKAEEKAPNPPDVGIASVRDDFQAASVRDGLDPSLSKYFSSDLKTHAEIPKGPTPGNPANLDPKVGPTGFQRLLTGSGDDRVDINMGSDNRVHINVNGKEAWSGTLRQFQNLNIDTGAGADVVNNTVSGARINTGSGKDTVHNQSSGSTINTGSEDDTVTSQGEGNVINTGSGIDTVSSVGNKNVIDGGQGGDSLTSVGDRNSIVGGEGDDSITVVGNRNVYDGGEGADSYSETGNLNFNREALRLVSKLFGGDK